MLTLGQYFRPLSAITSSRNVAIKELNLPFINILLINHKFLHSWSTKLTSRRAAMADTTAETKDGGIVRTLKDLFAGAAGGVAQVLLGV